MTTFGLTLFLDGKQLQAQARLSAKEMERLGLSAGVADKGVRRASAGMKLAQSGASRLKEQIVGLGIAFVGLSAIRDIIGVLKGFEQTMAFVRGVTKATEEEFSQLTATARELGATTRFSAQQAGEGLLLLARAGFTAQESIAAVAATLDLAVAGGLELARATEITAASIRQFGLEADDARRVADVLVNTTNSTNTNVEQLGETMKFAGPVAGALGISLENAAAAAGVLGDAGIQAGLAGTQLRGIFAALLQTTDRGRNALAQMGLTLEDLNPVTNDLTDIFTKLRDANFSAAEAVAIFGRRQASGALVLSRNVEKVRELTEANENAAGSAAELAAVADDTLNGALLALRSALEEAFLASGDAGLAGGLRDLVDFSTDVVRTLAGVQIGASEVSAEARITAEAIQGLSLVVQGLIGAGLLRFLAGSTRALIGFASAGTAARLSTSGWLLVVAAAVVTIREFSGSTNAAAESLDRLADAQKRQTQAQAAGDLQGQVDALKEQRDEIQKIRADITAQRNTSFAGAGFFRELEEGAGGETTTPVIGKLREFGSQTLLFLSGQQENLEERRKEQERIEKEIRELNRQIEVNQKAAAEADRDRQELIRDLAGEVSVEALFNRFSGEDISRAVGANRFAEFQQQFTANFASAIEDAFRDVAPELRDRLKSASGEVRSSIQEAIDRIQLQRADLQSGIPEGLRSITKEIDKELAASGRSLDAGIAELVGKLRENRKALDDEAAASASRRGAQEFVSTEREQSLLRERSAIQDQIKALQELQGDLQTAQRDALIAGRQQVEVSRVVDGLTRSLNDQQQQILLTDKQFQRYNATQNLTRAIQDVGAEGTEFAAEAFRKLNQTLDDLEKSQAADALSGFVDQADRLRQSVIGEAFDIALGDDKELVNLQRQLQTFFNDLDDNSEEAKQKFREVKAELESAFAFVQSERRGAAFDRVIADVDELLESLDTEAAALEMTQAEQRKADALQQVETQYRDLIRAVKDQLDTDDPQRQEELNDLYLARDLALQQVTRAVDELTAAELRQRQAGGVEALDAQAAALQEQARLVGLNSEAQREYNAIRETTRILDEAGIRDEHERARAIGRTLINLQGIKAAEEDRARADAIESTREQTRAFQEQINTIGLTGTALERYNTLTKLRAELEETGALKTREGVQALEEAKQKFDELERVKALKGVFDEVGQALGDAFTDFIVGAKSAREALEDFLKQVSRALVQKAVASLIGGIGTSLFAPSAKGNVFDRRGITPFARGGVVDRPTLFPFANGTGLMGEAGPEAILPLTRGSDGTLGVQAEGMGAQPINVTLNISTPDADSFRKSQKQTTAAARRAIGQARGNAGR